MVAGLKRALRKHNAFILSLPALFWLLVFFITPLLLVLVLSFMSRDITGRGTLPFTFEQYERVFTTFRPVFVSSINIALISTVVCLLIGYPLAFYIKTRRSDAVRNLALFLVILPFWTNFLVRTYAWRVILGQSGPVNTTLLSLGLVDEPVIFLNTQFAVIVGMVYTFLPFMVLPIYASVERFDFRQVEAARDLGANDWHTFWRVVLPQTMPGVVAGCILVFIPAIGAFITPDLLGGRDGFMIGNLITRQYKGTGNVPLGAAASMVLMGAVMLSLLVYIRFTARQER
ncbi:MAG: ABC transporter permease [Anaerolineaceae bacterium]|nr:MAG: ABC transporter permease [Anaerolineaceae bacterium]